MSLEVDPRSRTLLLDDLVEAREIKSDKIEYVTEPISYWDFFSRFLVPNKPCVFGPSVTKDWLCRKEWVTADGKPDLDKLKKNFGSDTVPVANCDEEKYSSHIKSDMLFGEYIDYWKEFIDKGYPKHMPTRYCKDWHMSRAYPEYKFYTTPTYFESDWLNEFWDNMKEGADDYRFVYMGAKGTWTPFHADVLRSYSWSANICGRKKWIFFPPGEEKCLTDRYGQLAYDITSDEDLEDTWRFPHAAELKQRFEIFQEAGEMVFVPSGWHHQVFNLDDTISINHNWMNGCNIDICWDHVKSNLEKVKEEIEDCRPMMDLDDEEGGEFSEKCQVILRAASGIDYAEFFNFMYCIACNRMKTLQKYKHRDNPDSIRGENITEEMRYCENCSDCEELLNSYENYDELSDSGSDACLSASEKDAMRILLELEREDCAVEARLTKEKTAGAVSMETSSDSISIKTAEESLKVFEKDTYTTSHDSAQDAEETAAVLNEKECDSMTASVTADQNVSTGKLNDSSDDSSLGAPATGTSSGTELGTCGSTCKSSETKHDGGATCGDKFQQISGCSLIQSKSICQTFGFASAVCEGSCSHFLFDINRTIDVIEDMMQSEDFQDMDESSLVTDPEQFLWHLKHFVKHYLDIK